MKPPAKTKPKRRSAREPTGRPAKKKAPPPLFSIVGLGASAGGLAALEQFLRHVPHQSGLAYVIVQHLDPTHQGFLHQLLQRTTRMKVQQITDRMRLRPDHVYVIPPNKDLSLLHGVLHLLVPTAPRGRRLPIDFFLRSLAQDRRERSIAVILSGMGSDGTLGSRAIKEASGLVLVQEPETAAFDGMPRSAIEAGLADVVAPVDQLPGYILAHLRNTPCIAPSGIHPPAGRGHDNCEKAILLLRAHTGHDFSLYKRNTLSRRIDRRMGVHKIARIETYVRYLQNNSQELDLLFKELLIGVTNFFRDPPAWKELSQTAIPALLAARSPGQTLRAWVPGCSTGEEAYSLAMAFQEAVELSHPRADFALQIFATDLNPDAIHKARRAHYPVQIRADVPPAPLNRYFVKEDHGYRVRKEIRDRVIFAPQNLIMDPPFTKLDILCCRNVLIYLTPEVQQKLIPLFHHSLNEQGILFLGSAETIGASEELFVTLGTASRLFRRAEPIQSSARVTFPASFGEDPRGTPAKPSPARSKPSLQTLAEQLILQRYAPPAVLVNEGGDIFYISGRTGRYLEPPAGKADWNLFSMAREGLRYELTGAFQKSLRESGCISLRELTLDIEGRTHRVNVTLQRLEMTGPLHGLVMIVVTDVPLPLPATPASGTAPGRSSRNSTLDRELLRVRTEARSTQEAMQLQQGELRSANEELQSTNEELQSTNEELTTSKEEMQSLNEEMQTLNTELQSKLDELSRASDDMRNLLDSTDIATVFLDGDLRVRRFTAKAVRIIKLIPSDLGRPFTDLVCSLVYPRLADDVRKVLRTLASTEKRAEAEDGRSFTVRIMPYRTMENRVDGVVITFTDIAPVQAVGTPPRPGRDVTRVRKPGRPAAKTTKKRP